MNPDANIVDGDEFMCPHNHCVDLVHANDFNNRRICLSEVNISSTFAKIKISISNLICIILSIQTRHIGSHFTYYLDEFLDNKRFDATIVAKFNTLSTKRVT